MGAVATAISAVDYIEAHLTEKLNLETVAAAVHYSKYHLHRVFASAVGLTVHDYIQRRRLTEAAKLLSFSETPVIDIALLAGYESQQAFTAVFKAMYKRSPGRFRAERAFYPLQHRCVLRRKPARRAAQAAWAQEIDYAAADDLPAWMDLARLVVDGFPCLDEAAYPRQIRAYMERGEALICRDGETAAGVMAFCKKTGTIDFLGVHPQYRNQRIAGAFLSRLPDGLPEGGVSITTFREGDRADPGYRASLKRLGFAEAELLTEFGYPTQRFVWPGRAGDV